MQNELTLSPETAAQTALTHIRAGQLEQAEVLCAAILNAQPGHPDGLHVLGALRLKQQRFDEAITAFSQAVAWLDQHPAGEARNQLLAVWRADLGLALNAANRLPEALLQWQHSARLHAIPAVADWIVAAEQALTTTTAAAPAMPAQTAGNHKRGKKNKPPKGPAGRPGLLQSLLQRNAPSPQSANPDAQALLDAAQNAYLQGEWVRCQHAAQQLVALAPRLAEGHHLLAASLRQQQQWPQAEAAIQATLRLAPEVAAYHNTAGLIAADQDKLEQARQHYRQALLLHPEFSNAWNNLGIACRNLGLDDEAIDAYKKAAEADPQSHLPHVNLAGLLHALGRFDEALATLKTGLSVAPDNADLWCNLGVVLKDMGRLDEAEAAYRKSLCLAPDDAAVWTNLGNLLDEDGRLGEALEAKEHALKLDPNLPNGWLNYGNVLKALGREQDAVNAYMQAIRLDGRLYKAQNNLANLYRSFGHSEKAIDLYRAALAQAPEFAEAWCGLGAALQEDARLDEAASCYDRALQLQADMKDVIFNYAMLRSDQGAHDDAHALVDRGLAIDPDYPQAWMTKAGLHKRLGELPQAISAIRHAINLEWTWLKRQGDLALFADSTKPPMKVDDAGDALLALKQFLDGIGVPFFLAYGTLLGIYRDGDLLPFDKDMDVGIPWEVPRPWLIEQVQASGVFEIKGLAELDEATREWNFAVVHKPTGVLTDFFFFKPDGATVLSGFHHLPHPVLWRFSAIETAPMLYRDHPFPAPADPERFLVEIYGADWRIPDPYFDSVVSGRNLVPECRDVSIVFGYLRLFERLNNRSWKKAYGYCHQLFAYQDDPWLHDLAAWLQEQMQRAKSPV